mmetsp:Transcript_14184/g.40309  ORF Transcript_14184/g.40309 Transcript_14184/m.40309 type:complete len:408 (+) Transcript_14184:1018-2241(+)
MVPGLLLHRVVRRRHLSVHRRSRVRLQGLHPSGEAEGQDGRHGPPAAGGERGRLLGDLRPLALAAPPALAGHGDRHLLVPRALSGHQPVVAPALGHRVRRAVRQLVVEHLPPDPELPPPAARPRRPGHLHGHLPRPLLVPRRGLPAARVCGARHSEPVALRPAPEAVQPVARALPGRGLCGRAHRRQRRHHGLCRREPELLPPGLRRGGLLLLLHQALDPSPPLPLRHAPGAHPAQPEAGEPVVSADQGAQRAGGGGGTAVQLGRVGDDPRQRRRDALPGLVHQRVLPDGGPLASPHHHDGERLEQRRSVHLPDPALLRVGAGHVLPLLCAAAGPGGLGRQAAGRALLGPRRAADLRGVPPAGSDHRGRHVGPADRAGVLHLPRVPGADNPVHRGLLRLRSGAVPGG